MSSVEQVQNAIGYVFQNSSILDEALTHASHLQGKPSSFLKDNERLEFLGDAVLGLVVSDYLASTHAHLPEGDLSKIKARLVSKTSLAHAARRLNLGPYLRLGRGEEVTRGRVKSSILANTLEAVIAAVYVDGGLEPVRSFVLRVFDQEIADLESMAIPAYVGDFKSRLQEHCQQRFETLPLYTLVREYGPDHQKEFEVQVGIQGKMWGRGVGKSKKEAEQMAAKQALEQLIGYNDTSRSC